MSFRELRNFSEIMRVLGYPRLISIENFRKPNFPLVAELLQWLVSRFDESIELIIEIETEQDRVIFIKSAAQLMALRANVKLNTKKLYMADGHAVQELLKISNLLYKASRSTNSSVKEGHEDPLVYSLGDIGAKIRNLKAFRQLASEIAENGANLYDMLGKELELREQRIFVLNRQMDIKEAEKCLHASIKSIEKEFEGFNYKIENVGEDEINLDSKISKKREELERNQKRLLALKTSQSRPAFMDEFEKLEEELTYMYDLYVLKFRCLVYLEEQLEEIEKVEMDQKQDRELQIIQRVEAMREEQMLSGDILSKELDDDDLKEDINQEDDKEKLRHTINTTTAKRSATGRVRVFGSVSAEDKEESLDSDLDLEGEDGASDLDSELDEDLDLLNYTNETALNKPEESLKPEQPDSDNDF